VNGSVALITGIVGFIFGALSFTVGCELLLIIWLVIVFTLWMVTMRIYSRAQSSKRAAAVGFYLAFIGWGLLLWTFARCYIF